MNTYNEALKSIIETWDSLTDSIERAGGAGGALRISQIYKMSALEFIAFIAPNKIRFTTLSETNVGQNIRATSFDKSIL